MPVSLALDADTTSCSTVLLLIATAAHPLNEPRDAGGLVYEGYGILTPRIQTQPGSALKTLFSRVMAGRAGSSPYDTHSRDFYQDAFGSSVFCGKGLINRRAMDALLPGRFPQNRVLSHDILEEHPAHRIAGCVQANSSLGIPVLNARLTRWIRGDWQNALDCLPIRGEGHLLPAPSAGSFGITFAQRHAGGRRSSAAGAFTVGNAAGLGHSGAGGMPAQPVGRYSRHAFARQRRYFGQTFSHTAREALGAPLFPGFCATAWDSGGAAVALARSNQRSCWLDHSRPGELRILGGWYRRMAVTCVLGAVLAVAGRGLLFQLLGLLFLAAPALGYACAREKTGARAGLTGQQREEVAAWCAQMWQFYEHYAGVGDHFLPPDNVQLAPVYRVAHRTSPTNIGMMLLSALAAADFGFLAPQQLCRWVSRVLDTVESLERWHGNLYNWYDTQTLAVLEPSFVSTVDSGNFVTSLVALETGLREYAGKCPQLLEEARRVRCIIDETDLSVFYRKDKGLFSIGYDPSADTLHSACYDFLMSEARATSYFAVATRQAPKKHWNSLSRALSRQEGYVGPLSWTGTMFEYLMPHLLLPAGQDTFLSEAVQYAIWAQRRRAAKAGVPWGISESAYFAFDAQLNYQYKAHGVQKLGVKEGLDRELVLSPYSTFLALPFVPQAAMKNLHRLQQMGLYGVYGFYEAVDCTPSRAPQPQICRSYMAHHVGMSIAAGCNAVFEGRMQKRFMKGAQMRCAREFLEEQLEEECVVNRKIRGSSPEKGSEQQFCQEYDRISPQSPRCMLYSNGDVHLLSTDCGAAQLNFRGLSILRPGEDLLRSPQGIFICLGQEGTARTLTAAPGYGGDAKRHTQFSADSVSYHLEEDSLQAVQQLRVHRSLPAVQVQLQVKNRSRRRRRFEALYYLEPVLCRQADYQAHPAFSKLFVTARLEKSSGVLLFQRRLRPGEAPVVLGVSFLDAGEFSYETRREKLIGPEGGICLEQFPSWKFSGGGGVPDAVCALRRTLSVSPRGQGTLNLLLACAPSESEVLEIITRLRHEKGISQERAAVSPLAGDSLPARLMFQLLPRLLYPVPRHRASREEILNRLERRELWSLGVSGDFPIVLYEANTLDPMRGEAYLKALKTLRERQVPFDLVFAFPKEANTTKPERDLTALIHRGGYGELLRARGGVHLVHPTPEQITLLRTCSVYQALRSMERTEWIEKPYHPAVFCSCLPQEIPQDSQALQTQGGVFCRGSCGAHHTALTCAGNPVSTSSPTEP
ncbi:MAG: glucoamylase family protein [Oscillospiraceae bacterium]